MAACDVVMKARTGARRSQERSGFSGPGEYLAGSHLGETRLHLICWVGNIGGRRCWLGKRFLLPKLLFLTLITACMPLLVAKNEGGRLHTIMTPQVRVRVWVKTLRFNPLTCGQSHSIVPPDLRLLVRR